jgi:uncharacterized metal-binding protein
MAIGAAVLIYHTGEPAWAALPVGGLAGLLLSPDLDVERGSIANHHARKFGRLFGFLWRIYWWPYGKLCPHRGASHWLIFGTVVRLIYAFWWLPLVWLPPLEWAATFAAGLAIVDSVHIVGDWIF